MAEEVNRRLRNTSREVESSRRVEIVERVCTKMATSGHKDKFIKKAVIKGLDSFNEKVRRSELPKEDPGYHPLYHNKGWKRMEKDRAKVMKKKTWYVEDTDKDVPKTVKKKTGKKWKQGAHMAGKAKLRTQTVVFVPSTKGGILVRKLREREEVVSDMTGFKIRFQ